MIQSLLIAVVISIDAFASGLSYGIKNIKIPKLSLMVMNIITISILGISMYFGDKVKAMFGQTNTSIISFLILFSLGCYFIIDGYIKHLIQKKSTNSDGKLLEIKLSKLGIIIDVAIDYTKADMDISGEIDIKEAIYLSLALSLDSLGVGFGSAIADINYLQVILVTLVFNIIAMKLGMYLGRRIKNNNKNIKTFWISGLILILLGITKLT